MVSFERYGLCWGMFPYSDVMWLFDSIAGTLADTAKFRETLSPAEIKGWKPAADPKFAHPFY